MYFLPTLLIVAALPKWSYAQETEGEQFIVQVSRPEIWQYGSYVVTAKVRVRIRAGEYWQVYQRGREPFWQVDSLIPPLCRFHRTQFAQRPTTYVTLPSGSYSELTLSEIGVSPTQSGIVKTPSLSVKVVRFDSTFHPLDSVVLHSQPVSVRVKALPPNVADSVYQHDAYRMVGSLQLEPTNDKLLRLAYRVGDTIRYSFTLTGQGSGHPIEPIIKPSELATVTFTKVVRDTALYKSLRQRTTFELQIISHRRGNLKLEDLIQSWSYFSVAEERIKHLALHEEFTVLGENRKKPTPSPLDASLVVMLDISESMRIRDYPPNRLSIGVALANLIRKQHGAVPVVVFKGDTKVIEATDPLDTDVINLVRKSGTAIGDALWQAKEILGKSNAANKRIILISDGDNTAGSITETLAAHVAHRHGIIVHSIGLGYTGIVPFLNDLAGDIQYIENSYDDRAIRKVAQITKGTFTWVSREDDLATVVQSILR